MAKPDYARSSHSRSQSPGPSSVSSGSGGSSLTASKTSLLSRLHQLLGSLGETAELLKTWPSSQDSKVHYDTTTQLIQCLQNVVNSVKEVEVKVLPPSTPVTSSSIGGRANMGEAMSQAILESPVSLDLLDLMDYGGGLNPDIFAKQLILEAMRQLSVLRRRKEALEMLGAEIQKGMQDIFEPKCEKDDKDRAIIKRTRSDAEEGEDDSSSKRRKG